MAKTVHNLWPVAALIAVLSGCGQEFAPPSLIDKLRIIGAQAAPPEIRVTQTGGLRLLVVGSDPVEPLCYAWAFCPFAWAKDGNFQCIDPDVQVDLGTSPTATIGIFHVLQALQNAGKVFDKLGLKPPTGAATASQKPDLGCQPGGVAPSEGGPAGTGSFGGADIADMYILFQVAQAKAVGGTCPASSAAMLATPCVDRDRCVAGYKRMVIATPPGACGPFAPTVDKPCPKDPAVCAQNRVCGCDGTNYANDCERIAAKVSKNHDGRCQSPNENPVLLGLGLRLPATDTIKALEKGVNWAEEVTPTVAEGTVLQLWPRFDAKDKQVVGPSQDPKATKPETETLVFAWYTDGGSIDRDRSYDDVPETNWTAPTLAAGRTSQLVRLWVVVRDGRNGTDWLQRTVLVQKGLQLKANPLCGTGLLCPTP